MSAISSVGAASPAWPTSGATSASRDAARAARMFAKADGSGDGSVDATELQSVFDHIKTRTGNDLGDAAEALANMDSSGDGSLSSEELDAGMQSLLPPPSSTVEFAQQRGADGAAPPPPPAGGADAADSAESSDFDPLDINQDGVVSPQERAAGELEDLLKLMDSNGDSSISTEEVDGFMKALDSAITAAASDGSDSSDGSDTSSITPQAQSQAGPEGARPRLSLSALTDLVREEYAKAAHDATETAAVDVSV